MKLLLRPLALIYGFLARWHRKLYEWGTFKKVGVGKPVISIGNITMGGTGKTPLVLQLVRDLDKRALKPAVVVRSYKGSSKKTQELSLDNAKDPFLYGDEACLYKIKNPHMHVFTGPSKVKSAMQAAMVQDVQVIVVDDGFQHHKLHKDWNGIIIDSTRPQDWKYFPEGRLREGFATLKKADAIFLSRSELIDAKALEEIKKHLPADKPVFSMQTQFRRLRSFDGHLIEQKMHKIGLVCALGNPEQFHLFFKKHFPDVVVVPFCYRDHHAYNSREVGFLESEMTRLKLDFLITTEKDEAKIRKYAAWPHNWAVVDIEMAIQDEEQWRKYWDQVLNELVGQNA